MTEVAEITVKLPPMYPKQRAVFYDPARIVVCEATTKAGKTTGGLVWLMDHELFSKEAGQSIWTCPIHAQAISTAWVNSKWSHRPSAYWVGPNT